MSEHNVTQLKKDCIGCGACAAITPKYWEMDEQGLAQLKRSVQKREKLELKIS